MKKRGNLENGKYCKVLNKHFSRKISPKKTRVIFYRNY